MSFPRKRESINVITDPKYLFDDVGGCGVDGSWLRCPIERWGSMGIMEPKYPFEVWQRDEGLGSIVAWPQGPNRIAP